MTDLENFCDQLVKAHQGDVSGALSDFFQLLAVGDATTSHLAANNTILDLWNALQRAAGP